MHCGQFIPISYCSKVPFHSFGIHERDVVNFCVDISEFCNPLFLFHIVTGNIFLWASVLCVHRGVIPNGGA